MSLFLGVNMKKEWWKEAFGYQIYIRSFYDGNHDGIGDLPGIIEKLEYIKKLGVDLIWICPFYESPMDDNGYDVSDFYSVSKDYGTIGDIQTLIQKAHSLNIRVVIDLVLNHTSDEHPWFKESRKSRENPYRDYYIWQKPRYKDNVRLEPTNWASFFGGSCWEYDALTDEYYMKIFSKKMPDLNWKNPKVIDEIVKMATWWCEMGVDGFRIDAVSHLAKADFVDSTQFPDHEFKPEWGKFSNLPKLHDYLKILNERVFSKYDLVTIGEVGGNAPVMDGVNFTLPKNQELDMVFNFDHNWCNNGWGAKNRSQLSTDVKRLKEVFNKWQKGLFGQGWNAIYWLNHDQPRLVSQYGDPEHYHVESAKMLATALYFMWGTPFIYNGEEIGMTNPEFKSIDDFRDVSTITQYHINVERYHQDPAEYIAAASFSSRDNARSLMQWRDAENGGFSKTKPWNIIGDFHKINVEGQIHDPNSIFSFYQKIIQIRKSSPYQDVIVYGKYDQILSDHPQIYGYIREHKNKRILVLANLLGQPATLGNLPYRTKAIILSNYKRNQVPDIMKPFEAMVLELEEDK